MHAVKMRTSYAWHKAKKIARGELILRRVYGEKLCSEFILRRESGKNLAANRSIPIILLY